MYLHSTSRYLYSAGATTGGATVTVGNRSNGGRCCTQLFLFGSTKDDGTPGDYVCKVRMHF